MTDSTRVLTVQDKHTDLQLCSRTNRRQLEQYVNRRRHKVADNPDPFRKLALSGDGNTLGAVSGQVLCLFNTRTRERFKRIAFDYGIEHVAISGNGQIVFVADSENSIHIIDVTFAYRTKAPTLESGIVALAADGTGSRLAVADLEGSITIIDTRELTEPSKLDCGFVPRRLAIREDGDLLVCFGSRRVSVFELSEPRFLARYGNDTHIEESPGLNGEHLVTETTGGFVVFDPLTGAYQFMAAALQDAFDVAIDGSKFVTAQTCALIVWDTDRDMDARQVKTYVRDVGDVKICDEAQSVYVCGDNAIVDCYLVNGDRVATYSDLCVPIMAAETTQDDRTLVVADERGSVAVYDLITGAAKRFHQHSCCVSKLCVEGSLIATGAHDGWARVLDLASESEVFSTCFPGVPVQAITLDGDRYVVTGNRLGQVHLYDLDDQRLVREFYGNSVIVRSLSISPCRRYLMSTNENGEAIIFNYKTGELVSRFRGVGTSYSGCFDETGEFLYFGDGNGRIVRARPGSKRISCRWPVHKSDVRSVRVENGQLVSQGISDDAFILDPASGNAILECSVDTLPFRRVAFTNAEGTRLVTGGQDGSLMFRDIENGSILAELRNLSQGFLWLTRDEESSDGYGDCFWTDQESMIQVYDRIGGIETLLSPTGKEFDEYMRIHNKQAMTMARVGMTPAVNDPDLEKRLATRTSALDWNPAALLEYYPD